MPKPNTYVDFEEFYESNGPDNAQQLQDLYVSIDQISDETYYQAVELKRGKIRYNVTGPTGEKLFLTRTSRDAFIKFIQLKHRSSEPELDIDEAAEHEYAIQNPHS